MATSLFTPPRRVFYGWWVIGACAAISALGGAAYTWGFSAFFLPLSTELGLSRAATSLAFSAARLEGGLEGPVVGWMVDRFGPRRIILLGVWITGLGFILLFTVHSFWGFFLVFTLLIGFGHGIGFGHPVMAAANSWFIRRKATAMGLVSAGHGVGGVMVPLVSLAIYQLGWRTAGIIIGIALWVLIFPLTRLVHRSPEAMGLLPDGDSAQTNATERLNGNRIGYVDFTVKQAMRTRHFWMLVGGLSLFFAVNSAVVVHFIPLAVDRGMSPAAAAGAMAFMAVATTPMRLVAGMLADRFAKNRMLALAALNGVLALVLLLFARQGWQLYSAVVIWAITYGMGHIHWSLLGDHFGRSHFATIRGMVDLLRVGVVMVAPVYMGWIYDVKGSYNIALYTLMAAYGVASLFYLMARVPKATQPHPSSL